MISLVGSRTADAQEPMCVPFLRGSVSREGIEPVTGQRMFGKRTTWCFASKGIGALLSRPPTLTIPSVRTGLKGSSGL